MFSNYCLVAIIGITSSFFSLKSEPNSFFSETGIKYFYNSRTLNHSDLIKHVKIISIRSAPNTKFWTEKKLIQRIMCVNRKASEKFQNQGRNHEMKLMEIEGVLLLTRRGKNKTDCRSWECKMALNLLDIKKPNLALFMWTALDLW